MSTLQRTAAKRKCNCIYLKNYRIRERRSCLLVCWIFAKQDKYRPNNAIFTSLKYIQSQINNKKSKDYCKAGSSFTCNFMYLKWSQNNIIWSERGLRFLEVRRPLLPKSSGIHSPGLHVTVWYGVVKLRKKKLINYINKGKWFWNPAKFFDVSFCSLFRGLRVHKTWQNAIGGLLVCSCN